MDQTEETWPEECANKVADLCRFIALHVESAADKPLAWRGHGRAEWKLETTLDRRLQEVGPQESYEEWLARERAVIKTFKREARPYATEIEKRHLDGVIWTALAFGRHAGLRTRLLDWTASPWVAAWFACHEHSDADGVIWWFNQGQLERVLGKHWDDWEVPCIAGSVERDIEKTAFSADGEPWITKLHYRYPCPRMEAQQGFQSVCGRLRKAHNDAIDHLPDSGGIARGRIRIPAGIKREVLALLRTMNIHAKSLEYPGVDIVARKISP